jgi:RNA polymerase sigma-70 factor (ECF subfamily)
MSCTDITELVQLAQTGDRTAFGTLCEKFQSTVYAIALTRLRNATEAQELAQEVFLHVMKKLPQLRDPQAFAGWLRQITVRMAINRITRRGPVQSGESEQLETKQDTCRTPLDSIIQSERAAELYKALDQLKPVDRATLVAFYIRNRSLKQMSREFEVPVGTIKRRLFVARNRLKEVLAGVLGEEAELELSGVDE